MLETSGKPLEVVSYRIAFRIGLSLYYVLQLSNAMTTLPLQVRLIVAYQMEAPCWW
jgi:hypothetical protein